VEEVGGACWGAILMDNEEERCTLSTFRRRTQVLIKAIVIVNMSDIVRSRQQCSGSDDYRLSSPLNHLHGFVSFIAGTCELPVVRNQPGRSST